jgi:hypothetical protein
MEATESKATSKDLISLEARLGTLAFNSVDH